MPYTNATLSTSLDTTYNAIAPNYTSFSSLQLITGIDLSAQLEVERVFASDRLGSTLTVTNFMNNADVKLSDKRAVYVIPITRCTLNATTSKITAIDLPASGNVYNYTYYLISDPTNANPLTIQVPAIAQGSALTIRRKTVTNQSFVNWTDGNKLTSAQLNLQTKQLLYLQQEMSDTLNTELARSNDITSQIADGAVTPTKISSTIDPWSFYGTIQTVAPTANLHATTRLYTLDKFFQHGVMTKDDVAPTSSAVDILETAATAGNSGLWFNPKNGTINLWAGNAWVTVAGTPVTTANLVSTNTVQTLTAAKTFAAGTVVPFTQTGTGAVARTVDAKLKDTVSVKDFGAVGDGVTDDTTAFVNAIASLVSIGCGTLLIPKTANSYRISSTGALSVSNTNGISIISNGATIACAARSSLNYATGFITGTNVDNLTVDGLRFVCYDTVSRYGVSGAAFDSYCNTADFPGKNPKCSAPYFGSLTTIVTNFRYGFLLTDVENVVIKNCYFGDNFYQPINFQSTGATTLGTGNKNILIENTTFDGANITGIFWEETTNITINNCLWNDCTDTSLDHAIYSFTNTKNLVITNSQTIGGMYGVPFDFGLYGIDTVTINNVLVDNCHNSALFMCGVSPTYVGGNNLGVAKNITVNNFTVVNQTTSLFATPVALITIGQVIANEVGMENVCLSNIFIYGSLSPCFSVISHASAASPHTNIVLDGFYFSNANLLNASTGCMNIAKSTNTVIKNGVILDASRIAGLCEAVITLGTNLTNVLIDNISIINQSRAFNPAGGTAPFCIRSTQTPITGLIQNCNFVNYNAGAINQEDIANYNTTLRHKNLVTFGRLGLYFTSGLTNYSQPIIISQPEVTLTVNSATPTVQYVTELVTANTVATSITDFTNGVDGQEITVRVNDVNTTFDFTGSSLKGNVGVNFPATSGDVLFAKKQGSNWYCTICNIS